MAFTFARIGVVVSLTPQDYLQVGKRSLIRFREKGGKEKEIPVHHKLEEYLDVYLEAAKLSEQPASPLFRSTRGRSRELGTDGLSRKRMNAEEHGASYKDLLYVRRRLITKDHMRDAIRRVVNAIFCVRHPHIWGEGTTACASDSKKFGAWDQNLMTEWHVRYGGRGVMIIYKRFS